MSKETETENYAAEIAWKEWEKTEEFANQLMPMFLTMLGQKNALDETERALKEFGAAIGQVYVMGFVSAWKRAKEVVK